MLSYNFTFPIISHNVLKQQNAPERETAGRVLLFLFYSFQSDADRSLGGRARAREKEAQSVFSAASTTWLTSTEVVTVPTPPGTGVMAPTTGSASAKRTSPQSLPSALT